MELLTLQVDEIIEAFRKDTKYMGGGAGVGFKEKILPYLDKTVPENLKAVNIIVKEGDSLVGYNTDAFGLTLSIEHKLKEIGKELSGSYVVVFGAGGVAKEFARKIVESDKFMREERYKGWGPMLFLGTQLEGKTLGIAGLGRIGSSVAKKAVRGMGMGVIYASRSRDMNFEKQYDTKFVDKNDLFRKADFISLHIPLLPETRHYAGKKELGMMKKTAYLINTSRGPVVDEKELVKALKNKKIAGAALDVFEFEPKITKGLARLNNAVLTPHIASATTEARNAMAEVAAKSILDALAGKKPSNLVNKEVKV